MLQVAIFMCVNLEEAWDILCLCPLPEVLSGWEALSSLRCSKVPTRWQSREVCAYFVCSWTSRCSWRAVFGVTINILDKSCEGQCNENMWSRVPLGSLKFGGALHCKRTHEPVRAQTGSCPCCLR